MMKRVYRVDGTFVELDSSAVNSARWAAANVAHTETNPPTMEKASEMAEAAICAYLGIDKEDWPLDL